MKVLTEEEFDNAILNGEVLVYFIARWLNPFRKMEALLEELEPYFQENNMKLYEFVIGIDGRVFEKYRVSEIPTLIWFKDGIEKDRLIGVKKEQEVLTFLCLSPYAF